MERLTHINLNPGEYNQELYYYLWETYIDIMEVVILVLTHLEKYVFQAIRINSNIFNMITEINASKTLT